jgi:hypothetical protein
MDPTANLTEQLSIARSLLDVHGVAMSPDDVADNAERLAELVVALDEWLRKGGFLPDPWTLGMVLDTKRREG